MKNYNTLVRLAKNASGPKGTKMYMLSREHDRVTSNLARAREQEQKMKNELRKALNNTNNIGYHSQRMINAIQRTKNLIHAQSEKRKVLEEYNKNLNKIRFAIPSLHPANVNQKLASIRKKAAARTIQRYYKPSVFAAHVQQLMKLRTMNKNRGTPMNRN